MPPIAPSRRRSVGALGRVASPFWRSMPEEQLEATKLHFAQTIPLGRTATIDEVASAYLFLMENGFVTGQHLAVDGGVTLRI